MPAAPASPAQQAAGATGAIVGAFVQDLANYIPTEIIAVYVAIMSLYGPNGYTPKCVPVWPIQTTEAGSWLWIATIGGAIFAPITAYALAILQARQQGKAPTNGGPIFGMVASIIAFLAWSTYLPNSIIALCNNIPVQGTIEIVIGAQFGLYMVALLGNLFGILNVQLDTMTVAANIRDGSILQQTGSGPDSDDDIGPPPPPQPVTGNKASVLASPEITPVFLGAAWNTDSYSTQRDQCYAFLKTFLVSPHYGMLQQPYGVGPATLNLPQPVDFAVQSPCSSSDVEAVFASIYAQGIPKTQNTLLVCFLPPNMQLRNTQDGYTTCEHTCGFHQRSADGTTYAVIPYIFAGCDACVSYGRTAEEAQMSAIVHEVAEAVTNPAPSRWSTGFHTPGGDMYEIGDMCVNTNVNVGGYNVQGLYNNSTGRCE